MNINENELLSVNGKDYRIIKFLGKGKGGYSYMEEWNFENWGIKYWSKTEEFLSYVEEHS